MTTQEAVDHFGGRKQLAAFLGVWPTATYNWGDYPPKGVQYELQIKTKGQLIAEGELNESAPT